MKEEDEAAESWSITDNQTLSNTYLVFIVYYSIRNKLSK